MRANIAVTLAVSLACLTSASDAFGFCHTTTCELPPGFSPTGQSCYPDASEFAADCYCTTSTDAECLSDFSDMAVQPVVGALTLWWRNACIGYDINQSASAQVPYATAAQIVAMSFSKWVGTQCPTTGGSSPVSIDVRDLGPVSCDQVAYNTDQGNQNVIIFRDDAWPYNDSANTLGLTTVTFDIKTGEIFDADMEINATVPLAVSDPVLPDQYDLQSIITHEAGHFLGLAHTPDESATMYAFYEEGSTTKRILTADDMAGICSIYAPDGSRLIQSWSSADGGAWSVSAPVVQGACDPTPRHGFQTQCSDSQSQGCAVIAGPRSRGPMSAVGAAAICVVTLARRRSTRGKRPPTGGKSA